MFKFGKVTFEQPSSFTTIESYASQGCINLKEFNTPPSVKLIKSGYFKDCSKLNKIFIPSSASIEDGVFEGENSLEIIYDMKELRSVVFSNSSVIKKIVLISNAMASISYRAFLNCQSLEEIRIPASISSIGDNAF